MKPRSHTKNIHNLPFYPVISFAVKPDGLNGVKFSYGEFDFGLWHEIVAVR